MMKTDKTPTPGGQFLLYQDDNGVTNVNVRFDGTDVWLTQQQIAVLFDTMRENVVQHIKHIYEEGELEQERTCKDFLQVQTEGKRRVRRNIPFYTLDMIIAVGQRVIAPVPRLCYAPRMTNKNIALLIDCENTSREAVEPVLNELAKYGVVNIRRAYGDWDRPELKNWKEHSLLFALKPVQQFGYTKGKNATDSAIVIDAMDILYSDKVDSFAIMSSDSDFTPLVIRLLESGKEVFGFGQKKTPSPFVKACSQFIFTEDLISAMREREEEIAEPPPVKPSATENARPTEGQKTKNEMRGDTGLVRMLRLACENTAGDDGWSHMSEVSQYMKNQKSYSPVNYGFKSWSKLIQAIDLFEGDLRNGTAMYIRDKRKKTGPVKR